MPFEQQLREILKLDFDSLINDRGPRDVEEAIRKEKLQDKDLLALLSPAARNYLEPMARRARDLTLQHFGRVIQLYMPLYLANHCVNECAYCGFNRSNDICRTRITPVELEENARYISGLGIRHLLILTGESPALTPPDYIAECVRTLRKSFSSVSLEVYPMDTAFYRMLKEAGADGLTVYQEVYDPGIYSQVHLSGPKKNYSYRLATPERAAEAGLRTVGIGPLFGLGEPMREAFIAAMHARWLEREYPGTEFSLSLPRINPAEGQFQAIKPLSDAGFVQVMLAFRLFLPQAGLVVSTRERAAFRDRLVGLGVTRMSAGSSTGVGGYTTPEGTPQFDVSDSRSVKEVAAAIASMGYEPVYKDWEAI